MTLTEILSALIQPKAIYEAGWGVAAAVAAPSGVLLLLCVHIRVAQSHVAGFGGQSQWGATLQAIMGASAALALYTTVWYFGADFANSIYAQMNAIGSIDVITAEVGRLQDSLNQKGNAEQDASFFSYEYWSTLASNVAYAPLLIIGLFIYYVTLIFAFALTAADRMLHAALFSGIYLLGYVLIPLGVLRGIQILNGWFQAIVFVFIWPVIESILCFLFTAPFRGAVKTAIETSTQSVHADASKLYIVLSIVHLLLSFMIIVAFFVAKHIAINSSPLNAANTVTNFFRNPTGRK